MVATSSGKAAGTTSQDTLVQSAECDPCEATSTLFVDMDSGLVGDAGGLDND